MLLGVEEAIGNNLDQDQDPAHVQAKRQVLQAYCAL